MTDWIEWNGGECPVAEAALGWVALRYDDRDAELVKRPYTISDLIWSHDGDNGDIVAYRVVDAPGASTGAQPLSTAHFAPSALATQVGGDHYKGAAIQPVEFCVKNKLESLESAIVKRAFRHDKPTGKGREDVEKIIHEAQLLIELKYGVAA